MPLMNWDYRHLNGLMLKTLTRVFLGHGACTGILFHFDKGFC